MPSIPKIAILTVEIVVKPLPIDNPDQRINDKGRGHKKNLTPRLLEAKDHQRWNDTSLDPNRDQKSRSTRR